MARDDATPEGADQSMSTPILINLCPTHPTTTPLDARAWRSRRNIGTSTGMRRVLALGLSMREQLRGAETKAARNQHVGIGQRGGVLWWAKQNRGFWAGTTVQAHAVQWVQGSMKLALVLGEGSLGQIFLTFGLGFVHKASPSRFTVGGAQLKGKVPIASLQARPQCRPLVLQRGQIGNLMTLGQTG